MNTFTIRVIRDSKDSTQDDKFLLKNADDAGYLTLKYEDHQSRRVNKTESKLMPSEVGPWLLTLLRGLALDDSPFDSIQVNSPCFPSFLFDTSSLKKNSVRREICNMLALTRAIWKNNYICEEDEEEDEEEDDCECEEGECDEEDENGWATY